MQCPHCDGEFRLKDLDCKHCGDTFTVVATVGRPRQYCSPECKDAAARKNHNVPKVTRLKAV